MPYPGKLTMGIRSLRKQLSEQCQVKFQGKGYILKISFSKQEGDKGTVQL